MAQSAGGLTRSIFLVALIACGVVVGDRGLAPAQAPVLASCADQKATIVGTLEDDVLEGTQRSDVIAGLGGNDVIKGLGGNDSLCGDEGDDRIFGGPGLDAIVIGSGADEAHGGPGLNLMTEVTQDGFIIADVTPEDPFPDVYAGGPGSDVIFPQGGGDEIDGGGGEDLLSYGFVFSPTTIDLKGGFAVNLRGLPDTIANIEHASGTVFEDAIRGDDRPNMLHGVFGSDVIEGAGGGDVLFSAIDGDRLIGGGRGDSDSGDTVWTILSGEQLEIDLERGLVQLRGGANPLFTPDQLVGIDNAVSGEEDDLIVGNPAANVILGGGGDDTIVGADGDDDLFGDGPRSHPEIFLEPPFPLRGRDDIDGGPGEDFLDGGALRDTCRNGETMLSCEDATAADGSERVSDVSVDSRRQLLRVLFGRSAWWYRHLPTWVGIPG